MTKTQILKRLAAAWEDFQESYAGLSEAQLHAPGAAGDWSVKDILAHVNAWEAEALKYLPVILRGERPPRYSVLYGGIDAFNAQSVESKRNLPLAEVQEQLEDTHRRLIALIQATPDEAFTGETPFRRRLRLDTYSHYPIHSRAIREWRGRAA